MPSDVLLLSHSDRFFEYSSGEIFVKVSFVRENSYYILRSYLIGSLMGGCRHCRGYLAEGGILTGHPYTRCYEKSQF